MKEIEITRVSSDNEVFQIIELQKKNIPQNISGDEAISQGFVTIEHSPEVLLNMNHASPSVIAKDGDDVVGYALVMPQSFRNEIPVIFPMFEMIDQLTLDEKLLKDYNYFVMGQVCIAKEYRGMGLFDKMYEALRSNLKNEYELMITEVASRNQRSLKAHHRVGMKTIHKYSDARGEEWEILLWDWR